MYFQYDSFEQMLLVSEIKTSQLLVVPDGFNIKGKHENTTMSTPSQ